MTAMAMKLNSMISDLDDKSISEVIKYVEYLVYLKNNETPNKITIKAFEEGEKMLKDSNTPKFNSVEALFADLDA